MFDQIHQRGERSGVVRPSVSRVHRTRRGRSRSRWWLLVALSVVGVACSSGEPSDASATPSVAGTTTTTTRPEGVTESAQASPVTSNEATDVTAPDDPIEPDVTDAADPPPNSSPTSAAADGSFCDELERLLDDWASDELDPAGLTPRYQALAGIAPGELVESFDILAEGNAILVATLDGDALPDEAAYDSAGERVAEYALTECGYDPF